jgi:hypothetical protein
VYTPYSQKKTQYYGVRCKDGGANSVRSTKFDFIASKIGEIIGSLFFTEKELKEIDARSRTDIALVEATRLKQLETSERRKKTIREDLAYLDANRLMLLKTGAYTPGRLTSDEMALTHELATLSDGERGSNISMAEAIQGAVKLSELLKSVKSYYDLANPQEKDRIVRVIFSELTLSENTFDYQCKNGFAALQNRFIALCDPTDWLSELVARQDRITLGITELTKILDGS